MRSPTTPLRSIPSIRSLDQYFLVRDVDREGLYLVAKVSTSADDCSRAMDLAADIVATFENPRA